MNAPVTAYETVATKTFLNLQQVMNANFGAKQKPLRPRGSYSIAWSKNRTAIFARVGSAEH